MDVTHQKKPFLFAFKVNNSVSQTVSNHTYLGLGISNMLKKADHINDITFKANRVLELLRRYQYCCSTKVKEAAYKTLVRPKLQS